MNTDMSNIKSRNKLFKIIDKIFKNDKNPTYKVAIIGNKESCGKIAAWLDNELDAFTNDNPDTKLEYVSITIPYDKYTIQLIYNNKMIHNNIYIIPCKEN